MPNLVLLSTPEYAGTLPGSFKNLLDWTVGQRRHATPDFDARHGFEMVGRLTDVPRGHDELLMRKRLAPPLR